MLLCRAQEQDSTVVLDPVVYGTSGPFAINIWIKPGALNGSSFQYLYSHAASKYYPTGWEPNQARPLLKLCIVWCFSHMALHFHRLRPA